MARQTQIHGAIRQTMVVVLAGGRGSRLMDLTDHLSKPGLDFGGKFKIVDFALSNCLNSGFRRIFVLTQYNSRDLIAHLQRAWSWLRGEVNEFVDPLPAEQRFDGANWYEGTADAVYRNLRVLLQHHPEHVMVLAGDHVYKMDYGLFLEDHISSGADMTISCLEVPRLEAKGFGVMAVDGSDRVVDFVEKPADPPAIPGEPDMALASMGIYLFKASFLFEQLMRDAADPDSSHDFGKDLIPYLVSRARVMAHRFSKSCIPHGDTAPYWRDVGTVDSFWAANLDLAKVEPQLNLYDESWPIFTYQEQLPPAKFVHHEPGRAGQAFNSLVADGCIVSGATVEHSVLFPRVRVNSYAVIEEAVILPDVEVGRHARLHKVVVDRGCRIPEGFVVGEDPESDARRFHRTAQGVVLITPEMLVKLAQEEEGLPDPVVHTLLPRAELTASSLVG